MAFFEAEDRALTAVASKGSHSRWLARWLAFLVLLAGFLHPISVGAADPVRPPPTCSGAWLGVMLDPEFAQDGVRIAQVDPEGPAALAGLQPADIVREVAGVVLRNANELSRWAAQTQPGEKVTILLSREGVATSVSVELWGVPRGVCFARLAEECLVRQDLATAEIYLRAAVTQRPRQRAAWERLAEVLARQNRPTEAAEATRQALEWEAQNAGALQQGPDRGHLGGSNSGEAGPVPKVDPNADTTAERAAGVAGSGRADGLKAMVAVGGIQVKAARAGEVIGDGLREMLVSALHQSGYLIVVERAELRGLMAEQDFSQSAMARPKAATPQHMDIAEIMVFGAVTEFEPQAGGSSFMSPIMGLPLAMGAQIKWSQMALDVRVVDVRTARVLGAQRIPGTARSAQGTVAGALPVGPVSVPAGLSVYRNTPMEWAIRDCIVKVAHFVINSIDEEYFRHR